MITFSSCRGEPQFQCKTCPRFQSNHNDGTNRYSCFICNWDMCKNCVSGHTGPWALVDLRSAVMTARIDDVRGAIHQFPIDVCSGGNCTFLRTDIGQHTFAVRDAYILQGFLFMQWISISIYAAEVTDKSPLSGYNFPATSVACDLLLLLRGSLRRRRR
jgi:hypothetical protein